MHNIFEFLLKQLMMNPVSYIKAFSLSENLYRQQFKNNLEYSKISHSSKRIEIF